MRSLEKSVAQLRSELETLRRTSSVNDWASDPVMFAREALQLNLYPWQAGVIGADSKRDILNCSRQAGKSRTAAVLALHEALYRPGSLTLLISPSQRQSSELFRKVMEFRHSLPWAVDLTEDNRLSMTVRGGGRVLSLPASESTTRGYSGVTLLIEDEASRVDDELYFMIRPMLAANNGRLVLMSTPWGKRGHFWDVWSEGAEWNRVRIPATDVPHIAPNFLEEERRSMPDTWFRQEYMTEFTDAIDSAFHSDQVLAALSDEIEPLF